MEMHSVTQILVVDIQRQVRKSLSPSGRIQFVCRDGIDFLAAELKQTGGPDWIIPAIPVHVASKWIVRKLCPTGGAHMGSVPENIEKMLPNALRGKDGNLYCSMADFLCPDDCVEPAGLCTVTQTRRPYRLYERLSSIQIQSYKTVVVKSQQICAGVGGYRPAELFSALEAVRQYDGPSLLCTSCKCHAVVSAIHRPRTMQEIEPPLASARSSL